jgi:UDP-GlcNAc:undecaprenyl-phosphate/decaprenyl-phosphate GlcNAc-1-phosphate transferase
MSMMLSFILALSLSTVALPMLIKHAAAWGLLDAPDARKHHIGLVPRVGGLAIAMGTLLSAAVWSFGDSAYVGFLIGSLVIVLFGLLDDRSNLDYRLKFAGQIVAALIVVGFGIRLTALPFAGIDIIPAILIPLTVIFLLASTNAFNLLDGLDGLAAGCGILSLAAIGVLALTSSEGGSVIFIAAAALGGILGFLRYNTHPAIVYMGDAGSQFLGFAIGALAILLIEGSGGQLSPALALPMLGLPVIDTALVMATRIREGRSPFSPDRNHIHHRLLARGLSHREAVAAIYLAQTMLVVSAIIFRNQSDLVIVSVYAAVCLICGTGYFLLRRRTTPVALSSPATDIPSDSPTARRKSSRVEFLRVWLVRYIATSLIAYLLAGAVILDSATIDIGIVALASAALAVVLGFWSRMTMISARLTSYLAVISVSYLSALASDLAWLSSVYFYLWLASIALAMALVMASRARNLFNPSPQDLLTVLVVLAIVALPAIITDQSVIASSAVRALVFLYACEILIMVRPRRASVLRFIGATSLVLLAMFHGIPDGTTPEVTGEVAGKADPRGDLE